MPEEIQFLEAGKKRETSVPIISVHVETLLLLTATFEGREFLRQKKVYPVIRELHKSLEDETVMVLCEKLVDVLMGEESKIEDITDLQNN